jgi:hypothetical protein
MTKRPRVKGRAVNKHHIRYEPEWVVPIYKGEHECLTKLNLYSRKTISMGLITSLLQFIMDNYSRATKLGEEIKK